EIVQVQCILVSASILSSLFPYTTLFRSAFQWCFGSPAISSRTRKRSGTSKDGFLGSNFSIAANTSFSMSLAPSILDQLRFTPSRSEEHTSELQSRENIVCRLLLV